MPPPQIETGSTLAVRYLVPFILLTFAVWRTQVKTHVPEPYLDEEFHVRQAQAYWNGNWTQWDPKITTPPGLYIWSYLICTVLRLIRGWPETVGVNELRETNVGTTALLLPWRLQMLLELLRGERNTRPSGARISHTVLNICLFPLVFFFSALYYTDTLALLVVVEAYIWDFKRAQSTRAPKTWAEAFADLTSLQSLLFLSFGLASLAVRQTNIFWVSVFFGGLQAVRILRQNTKASTSANAAEIVAKGLQGELYDPLVQEASFLDYLKTAASLTSATVKHLPLVAMSILPHLVILAAFGLFVLWNGGVVLGHHEFHTPGIHLPQMLYIWPCFIFFSWPLLLIGLANVILPSGWLPKFFDYGLNNPNRLPRILTALGIIPLMLAAIHFNTIVHPFILADNRHYVFYVFRLLTRYHPGVKYAVAPIYFLCAWAVITAFGLAAPREKTPEDSPADVDSKSISTSVQQTEQEPQTPSKRKDKKQQRKQATTKQPNETAASATQQSKKTQVVTPDVLAKIQEHIERRRQQEAAQQVRVSFVLVWLAATSLSLVTAPLVELRYFIIPWVMWRLHLPTFPAPAVLRQGSAGDEVGVFKTMFLANLPQVMETLWLVLVNVVTGYVFLFKGFEWPQEPGKVQRFMW